MEKTHRMEIEKTDGRIQHSKPLTEEDAHAEAEQLWLRLAGDGVTSRVSVIDASGHRVMDLEA